SKVPPTPARRAGRAARYVQLPTVRTANLNAALVPGELGGALEDLSRDKIRRVAGNEDHEMRVHGLPLVRVENEFARPAPRSCERLRRRDDGLQPHHDILH